MKNKLQIVNRAYFKEVIPSILPGLTSDTLYSATSSLIGDQHFEIKLSSNAFIDSLPSKYKPITNNVIQFTSLKVLFSILNEKSLRMYNLKNMNDPKEFDYLFNKLIPNLNSQITEDYYKNSIYLASFCSANILSSDSVLNLWRLYGNDGNGVVIEFNISDSIKQIQNLTFCKVAYEHVDLSDFIEKNEAFEKKYDVIVNYTELFKIPACMHKHPAYSVEQEERLIYFGNRQIPIDLFKQDNPYFQDVNKFSEVVNYYKFPLFMKEDYQYPRITIKKIQFGFKISDVKLKELSDVLNSYFWNLVNLGYIDDNERPTIQQSPLISLYR